MRTVEEYTATEKPGPGAERRLRRREHLRHQLGVAMIWLGTVVFAFMAGYSTSKTVSRTFALVAVWVTVCLIVGGSVLAINNRHRRN